MVNANTTTMLATNTGSFTINVTQVWWVGTSRSFCSSNRESYSTNIDSIKYYGNNPTSCGGNQGSIVITGLPASTSYTFNYSKNNVPLNAAITTNGAGSASITGLTSGNYTNFSLTGVGGCQSGTFAGPVTLSDPAIPGAPAGLAATPNPVCYGTTVNLSVINNPGAVYAWTASSVQAGLVSFLQNVTSMTALGAGNYTISVTQTVNNCTSPAATVIVNIDPAIRN